MGLTCSRIDLCRNVDEHGGYYGHHQKNKKRGRERKIDPNTDPIMLDVMIRSIEATERFQKNNNNSNNNNNDCPPAETASGKGTAAAANAIVNANANAATTMTPPPGGQHHLLYKNSSKTNNTTTNNNNNNQAFSTKQQSSHYDEDPAIKMLLTASAAWNNGERCSKQSRSSKTGSAEKLRTGTNRSHAESNVDGDSDDGEHAMVEDPPSSNDSGDNDMLPSPRSFLSVSGQKINIDEELPCPTRLLIRRRPMVSMMTARCAMEEQHTGCSSCFGTHVYAIRYPDTESLQRVVSGQDPDDEQQAGASAVPQQEQCPQDNGHQSHSSTPGDRNHGEGENDGDPPQRNNNITIDKANDTSNSKAGEPLPLSVSIRTSAAGEIPPRVVSPPPPPTTTIGSTTNTTVTMILPAKSKMGVKPYTKKDDVSPPPPSSSSSSTPAIKKQLNPVNSNTIQAAPNTITTTTRPTNTPTTMNGNNNKTDSSPPSDTFSLTAMAVPPKCDVVEWVTISEEHNIYVVDVGLSASQCDYLVCSTEQVCQGKYAAYTYAKQTLGCREFPPLAQASFLPVHTVVHAITEKFLPDHRPGTPTKSSEPNMKSNATEINDKSHVPSSSSTPSIKSCQKLQLDDREPHVVKYDVTRKERQKLDMHTDKSEWTFLIALSNGCGVDYEGGGTYFECLDATVHIQRGHALVFPGKLRHCGQKITSGLRFLLVGFLVDKSQPNPPGNNGDGNNTAVNSVCVDGTAVATSICTSNIGVTTVPSSNSC